MIVLLRLPPPFPFSFRAEFGGCVNHNCWSNVERRHTLRAGRDAIVAMKVRL
jgi:hypothetical protein